MLHHPNGESLRVVRQESRLGLVTGEQGKGQQKKRRTITIEPAPLRHGSFEKQNAT